MAPPPRRFPDGVGHAAGSTTVADLATKYNVNPLYAKGLTGAGKTIGIATLAGLRPDRRL